MRTLFLLVSMISLTSAMIRGAEKRGATRDLKGSKEDMGMKTMDGKSSNSKLPFAPLAVDRNGPPGPVVDNESITLLPAVTSAPVSDESLTPVAAASEFESIEMPTPSPVKATLAHPTTDPVEQAEEVISPVIGRTCPTSGSLAFQSEPGAVSCTSNADCSTLEETAFGPACCTYPYCVCAVRFLNDEKEFMCLSH